MRAQGSERRANRQAECEAQLPRWPGPAAGDEKGDAVGIPFAANRALRRDPLRLVAQQHGVQRDQYHVVEGELTLLGAGLLVTLDVVGDGTDGQRLGTKLGSDPLDTGGLHLDTENAVLFHHIEHGHIRVVEEIGREDVADLDLDTTRLGGIDRMTHQSEPPIKSDAEGRYPVPVPGAWVEI